MNHTIHLPEGSRLLHIGPHKTGTTTLQAAFHQNRESLLRQGVHYAGKRSQPMTAAMAVATGRIMPGDSTNALDRWVDLVAEINAAAASQTVISSEFFCEADAEHIRRIVSDLGTDCTHVVITLRPLVKILASQWQQYLQNRFTMTYAAWLDAMLNHADETDLTPSFWRRHRHDVLVRRWADVIGKDNVTVVVLDEADKRMLMRTFEEMLSLEAETLVPRDLAANRSLTFAEAEMVRSFNEQYQAQGWSHADYIRFVRFGAARYLQQRRPSPGEARVLTPEWAVERAIRIGTEMASDVASTGVKIVGNLDSLTDSLEGSAVGDNPEHIEVPTHVATRFSTGVVERIAAVPSRPAPAARAAGPMEEALRARHELRRLEANLGRLDSELRATRRDAAKAWRAGNLTTRQVLAIVFRRAWARTRRTLRVSGAR